MGLDNPIHIAFLVVILLLVFGAKRLPEIGRSLGGGMREFKEVIERRVQQPAITAAPPQRQDSRAGRSPGLRRGSTCARTDAGRALAAAHPAALASPPTQALGGWREHGRPRLVQQRRAAVPAVARAAAVDGSTGAALAVDPGLRARRADAGARRAGRRPPAVRPLCGRARRAGSGRGSPSRRPVRRGPRSARRPARRAPGDGGAARPSSRGAPSPPTGTTTAPTESTSGSAPPTGRPARRPPMPFTGAHGTAIGACRAC